MLRAAGLMVSLVVLLLGGPAALGFLGTYWLRFGAALLVCVLAASLLRD